MSQQGNEVSYDQKSFSTTKFRIISLRHDNGFPRSTEEAFKKHLGAVGFANIIKCYCSVEDDKFTWRLGEKLPF